MSELRDELEKNFASADLQSEEQPVDLKDSLSQEDFDLIAAPKSYTKEFQENFKALSPEWQKYLLEREKQTEKGFSELGNKLNAYKWSDKVFEDRKERLNALGFKKAQDYVEKLALLDDAVNKNPKQTLEMLEAVYGVQQNSNNASQKQTQQQILESIKAAGKALDKRQSEAAFFDLAHFVNAVNDNGQPKYPFYQDVKTDMAKIFKTAQADTLQEAYEKAVWLNSKVREKMIENKINNILSEKLSSAQNAKEASFRPKSKVEAEPKELSLREELEAQFRKEF